MLLQLSVFPIIIVAFFIYFKDKYEKEPKMLLVLGLLYGAYLSIPALLLENIILAQMTVQNKILGYAYESFLTASFTEEAFKFAFLYFLLWRNKNLNEPFDGIVYAVFISIGFALVENVFYVFDLRLGGLETALYRGIISVPAHALFGVTMGFYFAIARFNEHAKWEYLLKAFFVTFFVHGFFDFVLSFKHSFFLIVFYVFFIYLWVISLKKIDKHLEASPFRT